MVRDVKRRQTDGLWLWLLVLLINACGPGPSGDPVFVEVLMERSDSCQDSNPSGVCFDVSASVMGSEDGWGDCVVRVSRTDDPTGLTGNPVVAQSQRLSMSPGQITIWSVVLPTPSPTEEYYARCAPAIEG